MNPRSKSPGFVSLARVTFSIYQTCHCYVSNTGGPLEDFVTIRGNVRKRPFATTLQQKHCDICEMSVVQMTVNERSFKKLNTLWFLRDFASRDRTKCPTTVFFFKIRSFDTRDSVSMTAVWKLKAPTRDSVLLKYWLVVFRNSKILELSENWKIQWLFFDTCITLLL